MSFRFNKSYLWVGNANFIVYFDRIYKRDLRVIVGKALQSMLGNKQKSISVAEVGTQSVFVKNGNGIVLNWAKQEVVKS